MLEPTQTSSTSSEPVIDTTDGKDDKDPGNLKIAETLYTKLIKMSVQVLNFTC